MISRQENEIRSLKESKDKDRNILNAKEETLASLRKMTESMKTDLKFATDRYESCNKELKYLQERYVQLVEANGKQQDEMKELKRQISIRDDLIKEKEGETLFSTVVQKRGKGPKESDKTTTETPRKL